MKVSFTSFVILLSIIILAAGALFVQIDKNNALAIDNILLQNEVDSLQNFITLHQWK